MVKVHAQNSGQWGDFLTKSHFNPGRELRVKAELEVIYSRETNLTYLAVPGPGAGTSKRS